MKQGNQWKSVDLDVDSIASPHRNPGEEYLFYRAVAAGQIGLVQDMENQWDAMAASV